MFCLPGSTTVIVTEVFFLLRSEILKTATKKRNRKVCAKFKNVKRI